MVAASPTENIKNNTTFKCEIITEALLVEDEVMENEEESNGKEVSLIAEISKSGRLRSLLAFEELV